MPPTDDWKYDVAVSFRSGDESLARKLADRLSEHWRVFVYMDRQREIAGADGVEEFTKVFREKALLDVVLHREGWGDTRWTRLEAGAIKERQLETGFEALFVVKLDDSDLPSWVPSRHLYLDLDEFGFEELVGAVQYRLHDLGADPSPESAAERAKRLQREEDRRVRQQQILHSQKGVDLAEEALDEMLSYTHAQVEEIEESGVDIEVIEKQGRNRVWAVNVPRGGITFGWAKQWGNSLKSSGLLVRELDGPAHFRGWAGREPNEVNVDRVYPDLDANDNLVWQIKSEPDRLFSSRDLVDRYLSRLVERHFGDGDSGGARSAPFSI